MSKKHLSFQSFIKDIPDPRQQAKVAYPLDEIMVLSLAAVIAGCDNFVEIAEYGVEKLPFLQTLAVFKSGIPSHDTLSAVFRQLDPEAFSSAFSKWVLSLNSRFEGAVVALDGKTSRGSKAGGCAALHTIGMVKSVREAGGKTSECKRLFISSLPTNAKTFASAVRGHWGIENRLHWVLDMVFGDDHCRVRKDQGAKNFTVINTWL